MAEFQVTAQQLRTKAGELRDMNSKLKGYIEELVEKEANLATMWEGEAQQAFRNAFQQDKGQMDNFYNAIEQYASALEAIAAKYEQAESTNYNTASSRSY
jgi:WXG100 family type VII secretion target